MERDLAPVACPIRMVQQLAFNFAFGSFNVVDILHHSLHLWTHYSTPYFMPTCCFYWVNFQQSFHQFSLQTSVTKSLGLC